MRAQVNRGKEGLLPKQRRALVPPEPRRARSEGANALDAAAFLGSPHRLDWQPQDYRRRTGGSIPKILHHIFLDGEAEYDKCVALCRCHLHAC